MTSKELTDYANLLTNVNKAIDVFTNTFEDSCDEQLSEAWYKQSK